MPKNYSNDLRDVAFRKIGRNLVNFQLFERALKLIIVQGNLQGYASELAKLHRDKAKDIDRKPLGWLVEDFFKTVHSSHSSNDSPATELDEVWMSVSVRIESNKDSIQDRRRQLRELVKERNLLVHQLLANFDPESAESCEKLIRLLDEQVDRQEVQYRPLMRLIGNMHVAQQEILKQLEAELREAAREGGDFANLAMQ